MISTYAPVFCVGRCANGRDITHKMLAGIDRDIIVPLLFDHDREQLVGCATGFHLRADRLWAELHIMHPRYIHSLKRDDLWRLSANINLCGDRVELNEISMVTDGFFGARCELPSILKAA